MKRKNATRNALFSSIISLLLCVSMLVGTTFAWFTDKVESGVNTIAAGNLDIELYHDDKGTADFTKVGNTTVLFDDVTPNLWEPGALAYENFKIKNEGTLALKYNMNLNVAEESVVNGNKLSDVILVGIKAGGFTATTREGMIGEAESWTKLSEFSLNAHGDLLQAQEEKVFGLVLYWQPNANEIDNLYNVKDGALNLKIGVELLATQQMKEEDSFGKDYDEDAWVAGFKVYNAQDLQAAIDAGEKNIQLENDIDLTESLVIPAAASTFSLRAVPNAVTINLNGKTITGTKGRDAENNRVHVLVNNGNLIINGGTIKSAGYDGGSAIYNSAGASLTINDVALYGAPQSDPVYEAGVSKPFPSYAVNNYGNAVVNGATVKSYHGAIATGGDGVTVINDADIDVGLGQSTGITSYAIYSYENAQVTVNGGKFAFTKQEIYVNGGNTFCELGTNPIIINGGNYTGTSFSSGAGREYVISGGTFDKDPSAYAKEGFKAIDNGNGTWTVVFPQESFDSLIENAQPGETVEIPAGSYTFPASKLEEGMTLECAPGTVFEGKSDLNIKGAAIIGATFENPNDATAAGTINGTFKDCTFTGKNGLRWCYAGETVVFENCVFDGSTYGVHFDGGANQVKFIGCTFSGFNALGGDIELATFEGCTFKANGRSAYNGINMWGNTKMTNCTFVFDGTAANEWIDLCGANKYAEFTNCVVTDGKSETPIAEVVSKREISGKLIIDGVNLTSGSADLAEALVSGGNVLLNKDVETEATTTAPYGNKVGFVQNGGVLDGNGKKLSVECYGDDYGIMTSGGTIKNITIQEGCRAVMIMYAQEDVILDNVNIGGDGVLYPINTGEGGAAGVNLIVTNSTLAGWTSYGLIESASFTNVAFEQGTYYNNIYGRVLKPYVNTTLTDCSFVAHMNLDLSSLTNGHKIIIDNCTVNGQALTADAMTIPTTDAQYDNELFTVDLPSWANSISDCVTFANP